MESRRNRKKPKRVDVGLTESEYQLITEYCESLGVSKAEYLRRLFLKDSEQFFRQQLEEGISENKISESLPKPSLIYQ